MDGPSTRSVHADRSLAELPDVAPAIRPSTTFERHGDGVRTYRRSSHETTERFEAVVGTLEGGHAVAYASGMAAVAAAFDHLRPRRVSLPEDVYHGVRQLVDRLASRGQLEIVDPRYLADGDLRWVETPSNPLCQITDLEEVASMARDRGITTVCDATFATPVGLTPLDFGIDMVMHAATKAIAGHSDVLGGVLVASDASTARLLRHERMLTGAVPGSLDVWLALRGIRTLPLRIERASASAASIALACRDRGVKTYYPGLDDHPGHDVAERQMHVMGPMLSVDFGDAETADAFVGALGVFTDATSLGGVESLVERRALSDPTQPAGLVRLSVGIEDTEDLLRDVSQALDAIGS